MGLDVYGVLGWGVVVGIPNWWWVECESEELEEYDGSFLEWLDANVKDPYSYAVIGHYDGADRFFIGIKNTVQVSFSWSEKQIHTPEAPDTNVSHKLWHELERLRLTAEDDGGWYLFPRAW